MIDRIFRNNTMVERDNGGDENHFLLRCNICGHVFPATITDKICPKWKKHPIRFQPDACKHEWSVDGWYNDLTTYCKKCHKRLVDYNEEHKIINYK